MTAVSKMRDSMIPDTRLFSLKANSNTQTCFTLLRQALHSKIWYMRLKFSDNEVMDKINMFSAYLVQ